MRPSKGLSDVNSGEIYLVFTEPLDALGLDYMVTGSVASSSYGEPRFTHDIDLVLALPHRSVEQLWRAYPSEEFYRPPLEVLREEVRRESGGHFNLVHHESGFEADVYLVSSDDLVDWAFENARRIEIESGRGLCVAPPEYVILGKLQFYVEGGGERHLRDIAAMLDVARDEIDRTIVDRWARRLGAGEVWDSLTSG